MNDHPLSVFKTATSLTMREMPASVRASWRSPSNIALIKYWGKKEGQLPANPSLSMTLSEACTTTKVTALEVDRPAVLTKDGPADAANGGQVALANDGPAAVVSVNGDVNHPFLPKLNDFFQWLVGEIPVFQGYSFYVETRNSFPHSTGIASSASGMSAFTLCMLDIASQLSGSNLPAERFRHLASFASRMGSGSACRSLFGGFTVWGDTGLVPGSSDQFAVPVNDFVHPEMANLHDAILVVSSKPKSVASSLGHSLMNDHPFALSRFGQALANLENALLALKTGDLGHLGKIAENEALTLHTLIMTSRGGDILFTPGSIELMKRIRDARKKGLPVFFTLDAGPNVHLLYPHPAADRVEEFIRQEMAPLCEEGKVIFDKRGEGPISIVNPSS